MCGKRYQSLWHKLSYNTCMTMIYLPTYFSTLYLYSSSLDGHKVSIFLIQYIDLSRYANNQVQPKRDNQWEQMAWVTVHNYCNSVIIDNKAYWVNKLLIIDNKSISLQHNAQVTNYVETAKVTSNNCHA